MSIRSQEQLNSQLLPVMKPDQLQTPQGAHEGPHNDQRPLPQVKQKPRNHAKHGTLRQTSIPDPRCFLCFSKESKTNFPKQFIIDLSVVSKRYFILSLSLQDWKSSVVISSNVLYSRALLQKVPLDV